MYKCLQIAVHVHRRNPTYGQEKFLDLEYVLEQYPGYRIMSWFTVLELLKDQAQSGNKSESALILLIGDI